MRLVILILFPLSLFADLDIKTISLWGSKATQYFNIEDLQQAIDYPSDFQLWLSNNCMREHHYIGDPYSYFNPKEDAILVNDTSLEKNSYLLAALILDAKKSNAKYLILPNNLENQLLIPPLKILEDLHIYEIDALPIPKASTIFNEPVSIFTGSPSGINNSPWAHNGILHSLVSGLKCADTLITLNTFPIQKNVLQLAHSTEEVILLRNSNKIERLILGPNLVFNNDHFMADRLVNPGTWTNDFFKFFHSRLTDKFRVWPAGVDLNFWHPIKKDPTPCCLLYIKNPCPFIESNIKRMLELKKIPTIEIRYGSYKLEEYKEALNKSTFLINLSFTESQGISLLEAWAMNVPTFYLSWKGLFSQYHFHYVDSYAAPYANRNVALSWATFLELEEILDNLETLLPTFEPRRWVKRNLTGEISLLELLRIFKEIP